MKAVVRLIVSLLMSSKTPTSPEYTLCASSVRAARLNDVCMVMYDEDDAFSFTQLQRIPAEQIDEARWVLVFDKSTAEEGVYTIKDRESAATSVLAFASYTDAYNFAYLLSENGFDMATPTRWSANDMIFFCQASFDVLDVPLGLFVKPPAQNKHLRQDFRQQLEVLYPKTPENCNDDDCIT